MEAGEIRPPKTLSPAASSPKKTIRAAIKQSQVIGARGLGWCRFSFFFRFIRLVVHFFVFVFVGSPGAFVFVFF